MPRVHAALLPLLLLAALLTAGCGNAPPELNEAQAKFKAHVLKLLDQEKAIFTPLLVNSPNPAKALQKNIDEQFAKAIAQGDPLQHDLAVLDSRATVLAWRSPDPDDLTQTYLGYIGQNYSHFKKMDPVFYNERIAAFEVFTQYGPGFGICTPLLHANKLVGAFCLGYDFDTMVKRHGMGKDQLLGINFNR
ncbi:MAG: hypothetical protein K9K66_05605 [Desulfarculaceae bacterium]|nr:hypothetical protein [Desulfarculaceae bacterium]MCF8071280.1 hypothetical protein [Desulfarculaceae bacterium]MCF8101117.1 hypothetical protein [Desulfarculaceae bacterium]MCF8115334.1 hypothetical protein [Desulfarculaceae bacterium]